MTSLDYFYEEILMPICSLAVDIVSNCGEFVLVVLDGLLTLVYFLTIPLWIIPYLIIRHKRNKRIETKEETPKSSLERLLEIDERAQCINEKLYELEKTNTKGATDERAD